MLEGLTAFGPTALQGYGLTEASPIGALNPDTKPNSGSIGRKLPGFDIKTVSYTHLARVYSHNKSFIFVSQKRKIIYEHI